MSEPFLSVVVATRNDDHGGDPLKRLQAFINTFAEQCRRTSLDAELIVVEWNPPPGQPLVSELCRLPANAPFSVRFIEVPAQLHQTLRFSSVLPLFQMIAKNVGIRRARGRFVLATNIDVIFSSELVEELASGRLARGHLYRVDRHDIEANFPVEGTLAEQMAFCRTHQIRVHTRSGTHPVDSLGCLRVLDPDIVESTGFTLGSGWHAREGDSTNGFFRWASHEARIAIDRAAASSREPEMALDVEVEPNPYQSGSWVELEIRDGERHLTRRRVSRRERLRVAFDDSVEHHDIVIRALDSSGGRPDLPLFESREPLCYRVWHVGVHRVPRHAYDVALWRPTPKNSPQLLIEHTSSGVEIETDPDKYSYCAKYGPFESPTGGVCEFLLEYALFDGSCSFAVMDDEASAWLPSTVVDIEGEEGVRYMSLAVDLLKGARFSLYVSNNRAVDGVSRFVLRRLSGTVPAEQLAPTGPSAGSGSLTSAPMEAVASLWRRPRGALSSIERKRAQRFQDQITDESERVRDLEASVASLSLLSELAPLAQLLRNERPAALHQNACGDFQLMAQEHWLSLRGYPEFEMFSMSIDGLFEAIARAAGVKEHIFEMPLCAYHLEHEKGSGWTPEGEAVLRKRIAESGITWLDSRSVHIWTMYMDWLRRPMIFNDDNWGFGDAPLQERTLVAAASKQ